LAWLGAQAWHTLPKLLACVSTIDPVMIDVCHSNDDNVP
jgi:hypothetical protein